MLLIPFVLVQTSSLALLQERSMTLTQKACCSSSRLLVSNSISCQALCLRLYLSFRVNAMAQKILMFPGIFFSDNDNKGKIMAEILQLFFPTRVYTLPVILVDDTLAKCQAANDWLSKFGANFQIYHYTYSETRVSVTQMLYQFAKFLLR